MCLPSVAVFVAAAFVFVMVSRPVVGPGVLRRRRIPPSLVLLVSSPAFRAARRHLLRRRVCGRRRFVSFSSSVSMSKLLYG